MKRIASNDCPKCGCNDTEMVEAGGGTERPWARFMCGHCGNVFSGGRATRPQAYLEKRIPICPKHDCQMHSNGKPNKGSVSYYICPVKGCKFTAKGTEKRV